jgi:hypothetical protein
MGTSSRLALPDLGLPDNRGRQSTKGYPSSGGVVDPSHSGNLRPFPLREFAATIDRLQRVETRRKCSGDVTTQRPNSAQIKHRRAVSERAQIVARLSERAVASASV